MKNDYDDYFVVLNIIYIRNISLYVITRDIRLQIIQSIERIILRIILFLVYLNLD